MVFAPLSVGLIFTLFCHFIERKSIIHCTIVDGCFQASMMWRARGESEVRKWEGLVNTCIPIVSEDATLPGSGVKWNKKRKRKGLPKHTHALKIAYWSFLPPNVLFFHINSCTYRGAWPLGADTAISDETQSSESSSTFSWVPDDGCRTLQASVHSAFKGESFQLHCQLLGFNAEVTTGHTYKQNRLMDLKKKKDGRNTLNRSGLQACDRSLHRILSALTVGTRF